MSHKVITIGRQFGSGGHEIGEKLSQALHLPLYDQDLVEMAAEEMGMSPLSVEQADETVLNSFLSTYRAPTPSNYYINRGLPLNDSTYITQSTIIENLAKRGSCIIVGRCGDYVLRQQPDCVNIFICASMEDRIRRIMERYNLSERDAAGAIKQTDHRRKNYYETYTDQIWGDIDSHQLLINVSRLGMDKTVDLISFLYKQ